MYIHVGSTTMGGLCAQLQFSMASIHGLTKPASFVTRNIKHTLAKFISHSHVHVFYVLNEPLFLYPIPIPLYPGCLPPPHCLLNQPFFYHYHHLPLPSSLEKTSLYNNSAHPATKHSHSNAISTTNSIPWLEGADQQHTQTLPPLQNPRQSGERSGCHRG